MLMIEFFKREIQYTPRENDGALATDVDDGAISELDNTQHRLVKLEEHIGLGLNSRGLSSPEHENTKRRWIPKVQREGQR
jgi:hypothetical protein